MGFMYTKSFCSLLRSLNSATFIVSLKNSRYATNINGSFYRNYQKSNKKYDNLNHISPVKIVKKIGKNLQISP